MIICCVFLFVIFRFVELSLLEFERDCYFDCVFDVWVVYGFSFFEGLVLGEELVLVSFDE